jgi:hypothetical protein
MYVKAVNGRARSFFFLINFPTSAFVIEGKSQNREELRRLKKIHSSPWDVQKHFRQVCENCVVWRHSLEIWSQRKVAESGMSKPLNEIPGT